MAFSIILDAKKLYEYSKSNSFSDSKNNDSTNIKSTDYNVNLDNDFFKDFHSSVNNEEGEDEITLWCKKRLFEFGINKTSFYNKEHQGQLFYPKYSGNDLNTIMYFSVLKDESKDIDYNTSYLISIMKHKLRKLSDKNKTNNITNTTNTNPTNQTNNTTNSNTKTNTSKLTNNTNNTTNSNKSHNNSNSNSNNAPTIDTKYSKFLVNKVENTLTNIINKIAIYNLRKTYSIKFTCYNLKDLTIKLGKIQAIDDFSQEAKYIIVFEYILKPEQCVRFLLDIIMDLFLSDIFKTKNLNFSHLVNNSSGFKILSKLFCSEEFFSEIIYLINSSSSLGASSSSASLVGSGNNNSGLSGYGVSVGGSSKNLISSNVNANNSTIKKNLLFGRFGSSYKLSSDWESYQLAEFILK